MLFTKRTSAPSSRSDGASEPRILAHGARTLLREFVREDVDRWVAWPRHADPLFENYNPPTLSPRQRDQYYLQHRDAPNSRQFSVDTLQREYVGRISIRDIDWRLGASVLGISFSPSHLDRGLGTDALWAFLGYYYGPLKMSTLFLDVAAFNQRAQRVYEKCGFRKCGQRWGEPQTDLAGIFRKSDYQELRALFRWDFGLIRPLVYDMVLRRDEWERLRKTRGEPAPKADA